MTDSVKKAEGEQAPRGKAITEMGVSGLKHQGGLIMEEELRQLKGKRRLEMFNEIGSECGPERVEQMRQVNLSQKILPHIGCRCGS